MTVSAIIVAAGSGKRMGRPKQFLELNGIPICIKSALPFQSSKLINEIIFVVSKENIKKAKDFIRKFNLDKVKSVVIGGSQRQDSVFNGLKEVSKNNEYVLIHDGARPFASEKLIEQIIAELKSNDAVVPGIPVKDTIKFSNESSFVISTPDRKELWAIQTPQAFKTSLIIQSHKDALKRKFTASDDSSLVEKNDIKVKIIIGSDDNIKITTPLDMKLAKSIITETGRKFK